MLMIMLLGYSEKLSEICFSCVIPSFDYCEYQRWRNDGDGESMENGWIGRKVRNMGQRKTRWRRLGFV